MPIQVQLFITCLVEQFFPGVLQRMVMLPEGLGLEVAFPEAQPCCGQPFFNSGFRTQARDLGRRWIGVFDRTEGVIVSPSGSCVDMVRHHYPGLFPPGTPERQRAAAVASRPRAEIAAAAPRPEGGGAGFPPGEAAHPSPSAHIADPPSGRSRALHGQGPVRSHGEEGVVALVACKVGL